MTRPRSKPKAPQTAPAQVPVQVDATSPPIRLEDVQIAPAPTEPTDIVEVEPPEPRGGAWLMRANSFVEDVVDLLIGVGIICGLLLLGLSAVFPEIRPILIALAKHLSDNWKVLLILLYPMFRSSWRRVEPYIHELLWLKFGGGKEPTKPGAQVSPRKDG